MRVVITGAAGRIGSEVAEELSASHDLLFIDPRPVKGRKTLLADLSQSATTTWKNWLASKSSRWSEAFKETQAVVHLAATIKPSAPWEKVFTNNIQRLGMCIEFPE